ncbi:UDP-N-acetylmuramoyl-L-alanyl-D-glutamate--2, 6-diaminopimelate ligase, partial [Thalictrum thalictroides]
VARERKERQRLWAQRKTPRPIKGIEGDKLLTEFEHHEEEEPQNMEATKNGMLPNDIVSLLAAREKQVFSSDSEEENPKEKLAHRKKKRRNSGPEPVILNEIPHAQCVQNALKFLKEKKMQVSRSTSVLENSSQALRLISSSGLLGKK